MKQQYKRTEIKWYYSHYSKKYVEYGSTDYYTHRYIWHRRPRTHVNRKRLSAYPEFTRGKQRNLPSNWDDLNPSFSYAKCWKRFTKKRKQYL